LTLEVEDEEDLHLLRKKRKKAGEVVVEVELGDEGRRRKKTGFEEEEGGRIDVDAKRLLILQTIIYL